MKKNTSHILGLSWPIFVELLLQMLVGNADQIMVGWRDPAGVGAIGNANQVTNLVLLVFSVVCTASMILISQYIGARDTEKVNQTYAVALTANLVFGLAVSLILFFGCGQIFRWMGVHADIFGRACGYLRIIGVGMVFQAVYLTFTAFFRSSQMMEETMIVSVLMNCMNIVGNVLLINGFGPVPALGVLGAALSSDLSRAAGVLIIAVLFRRRFGPVLRLSSLRSFPAEQFRRLLAIGLPTGGRVPVLSFLPNLYSDHLQPFCAVCGKHPGVRKPLRQYNLFVRLCPFSGRTGGGGPADGRRQHPGHPEQREKGPAGVGGGLADRVGGFVHFCKAGLFPLHKRSGRPGPGTDRYASGDPPGSGAGGEHGAVPCASGLRRHPLPHCPVCHFCLGIGVGGSWLFGVTLGMGLAGLWLAMALDECIRAVLFLCRWHSGAWQGKAIL